MCRGAVAFGFAVLVGMSVGAAEPYFGPATKPEHAVTHRKFTGIPSLCVTPKGRLWATWYAGPTPGEDGNNYIVLSTSADGGETWKEVLIADPDGKGPSRYFDANLWITPDGRLQWNWAERRPGFGGKWGVKGDLTSVRYGDDPESETMNWTKPVPVGTGVAMGKTVRLSTGEWAMPVCEWFAAPSAFMYVSTDGGKSWTKRGGCTFDETARRYDEHMFVENANGDIQLWARTNQGMGWSVSHDRGRTWARGMGLTIFHTEARFFVTRLKSGRMLLVKHGPMQVFERDFGNEPWWEPGRREKLMAFLSEDDGVSWKGGLMIDARDNVSYPDGQQAADGSVYLIHDRERTKAREILCSRFTEEDVLAKKIVSKGSYLRKIVSKGSYVEPPVKLPEGPVACAAVNGVVWRGNPLEWKADGNALLAKGSVDGMAWREDAVRSKRVCVRARVTPGDVHSAGWATIGLAIRDDNENFWHLAFGRSPKDEGGVHIVELCEKRENDWLAQIQDGLPVRDAVQTDGNWKAGESYDFELTMDQKGIRGCIREASGKVLFDRSYAFPEGKPAVTAGVPAIHSTGRFSGRIDEFSFTAEDPAPVAAKAIPAYACENFARGVTGKRTGFFHVEKIDGRWWAVDPLGRGYIACGCDHVTYQGHYSERSKRWRHREANDRLFASKPEWEKKTVSRLLGWGFNQLGAGCDTALKYRGLSHTVFLSMGDSLCWNREDDSHWILPNRGCPCSAFPNVFHPDFPLWCDYVAREGCAPNRDDPWLYGYYLDNEFAWWGRGDKATGLFGVVRGLRKDHTAYLALADYVKSRVPGGLEALDRMPEAEAREVKRGFLRLCAKRYFSICTAAVRRHDPNHMVLGARFAGVDGADPVVWEEAGRHSDIVTFNSYPWCDFDRNVILERQGRDARRIVDAFAALQEHARCPMQITEWSFPALDTRCPCSFGGGQRVPTQKERVIASELFARTMLSLPFVVGYDYFMWVDEPAEGMNDNFPEDSNYGLLSEEGVPYEGLTGMFTRLQKDVARWRREPVPAERPAPPDRTYAVGRELALRPLDGTGVRYVREGDRYRVETPGGLVLEGAVGGVRSFDRVRFRGEEYGPVSVMVCVRMPDGAKGWFFADKVLSADWDEGAKCLAVESEGRYAGRTFAVRSTFRFAADRFLFEVPAFRNAGNLPVDVYSCYLRIDSPFAFESVAAHPDIPNCWSSESRTGWYAKDGRSVTVTSRSPAVTCFSYRVNAKDKSIHPDAEFEFPGGNDVTAVQVAAGASVDFKGEVWALFCFEKRRNGK